MEPTSTLALCTELKLDGNPGITPVTLAVRIERFSSNLAARGVCYDSVCVSCAASACRRATVT